MLREGLMVCWGHTTPSTKWFVVAFWAPGTLCCNMPHVRQRTKLSIQHLMLIGGSVLRMLEGFTVFQNALCSSKGRILDPHHIGVES